MFILLLVFVILLGIVGALSCIKLNNKTEKSEDGKELRAKDFEIIEIKDN